MSRIKSLSAQEERVLNLARQGLGDKQIAQQLQLSTDTVRTYWQRIRQKVGAATRAEIVATLGDKQAAAALEVVESEKDQLRQEIAHRKSIERALRASEIEWRRLADSMPQIVFAADGDGKIFHLNARFYEYTGASKDRSPADWILEYVHPEDLSDMHLRIQSCLITAEPMEMEVRLRRFDGAYRWHINRAAAYLDEHGQATRWYGTLTDIHDIKKVREELETSQAMLEQAQAAADIGSYEFDFVTSLCRWSTNLFAIFSIPERHGWFDADVWIKMIVPEDLERVQSEIWAAVKDQTAVDVRYRIQRPTGDIRYLHSRAMVKYKDGKPDRLIGTAQDVTQLEEANRALRLSEQQFRTMTESSPLGVFVTDSSGQTLYTNATYQAMTGLKAEEALGFGWVKALHPEDRDRLINHWLDSAGRATNFRESTRFLLPDGEIRWVYAQAAAIQLDEETHGYVGVVENITERKQAEAERDRLLGIIDATPDIIGASDLDLKVIALNAAGRKLFGVAEGEGFGSLTIGKVHPDWALQKIKEEGIPTALSTGSWTGESAIVNFNGEEVPTSQAILAHRNAQGEIAYLSTVIRDISAIKAVQGELEEQRRFIEKVLEANFDMVYIYDILERRTIYVNSAVAKIWGYSPDNLKAGESASIRKLFHPDDEEIIDAHLERVRALDDKTMIDFQYRILAADGSWKWMHGRESVFRRDENGRVKQIVGVAEQLTDQPTFTET
ncbi:MAG: hypothetical protein BGO01_02255 [Armatimonadetes bacterium 55-13]|nr:PAS domain-containing protein [Armatimonadota bacterium]OJU65751.1 MAG: hypothetical protein BGO01_02255 [Armatimonadetes bacterium 55-13]